MAVDFGKLTLDDCYDALVNWGGDPTLIESEADAKDLFEFLTEGCTYREITDEEEREIAKERLDLGGRDNVGSIYSCGAWSQPKATICFAKDWLK